MSESTTLSGWADHWLYHLAVGYESIPGLLLPTPCDTRKISRTLRIRYNPNCTSSRCGAGNILSSISEAPDSPIYNLNSRIYPRASSCFYSLDMPRNLPHSHMVIFLPVCEYDPSSIPIRTLLALSFKTKNPPGQGRRTSLHMVTAKFFHIWFHVFASDLFPIMKHRHKSDFCLYCYRINFLDHSLTLICTTSASASFSWFPVHFSFSTGQHWMLFHILNYFILRSWTERFPHAYSAPNTKSRSERLRPFLYFSFDWIFWFLSPSKFVFVFSVFSRSMLPAGFLNGFILD